jgi:hypothetical protein
MTQRKRIIAGTGAAPLSERKDDLYQTPDCAVYALLKVEPLPRVIWEPACGPGSIVKVLRGAGYRVHASDLVDYGCPESDSRVDFLMERSAPHGVDAIVTNPPYKLAGDFVVHAFALGVANVAMLLRIQFLESACRSSILDNGSLARVYVFSRRLPMMHRDGWDGPRAGSAFTFAWFVWEAGHSGPAELRRIAWEELPGAKTPRKRRGRSCG